MAAALNLELGSREDYYGGLIERLARAAPGERAAVATNVFMAEEPAVREVLGAMESAARRGVRVQLVVDACAFLLDRDATRLGPLVVSRSLEGPRRGPFAAAREALRALEAVGGWTVVINRPVRPLTNPIAGRSHIKYAVVGDWVWVGGCNLDNSDQLDLMVSWLDKGVAGWLLELTDRLFEVGHLARALDGLDMTRAVAPGVKLLVDAGARGRSLIYERALKLIDEAQKWVMITCQFYPNGETARRLLAAHRRGVKVAVLYNHPSRHPGLNQWVQQAVVTAWRRRQPANFFEHVLAGEGGFLHAKLIATEQVAMVGSHNYLPAGVKLGTAEMAVEVGDAAWARLASDTVWKLVA